MKKRIGLIIAIIVAVLLVGLLIWRFWPRSFSNLLGVDENAIASCSAYAMVGRFEDGESFTDTYSLNDKESDKKVYQDLVKILATSDYQQDFRNLLPWGIDSVSADKNYDGQLITVSFFTEGAEKEYFGIKFMSSSIVVVYTAEHPGMRIYHPTNQKTMQELIEYIKSLGKKQTL